MVLDNKRLYLLRGLSVVLALTAALKGYGVISSFITGSGWLKPNPIFLNLPEWSVLSLAALLEIVSAIWIWRAPPSIGKFVYILSLSGVFYLYRSTLVLLGAPRCHCLAATSGWLLHVENQLSEILLAGICATALLGCLSYCRRKTGKETGPPETRTIPNATHIV